MLSNQQIANKLDEIAELLEIEGSNYYRIRAYRNASKMLRDIPSNFAQMVKEGKDLTTFPGIGKAIAYKIIEIINKGEVSMITQETKFFSSVFKDLKKIPGIGPKKIAALLKTFPIKTIEQFKELLISGELENLPGFNRKNREFILSWLEQHPVTPYRLYLFKAERIVKHLLNFLRQNEIIKRVEAAGSYRRKKESISKIELVAAADQPKEAINYFLNYPGLTRILTEEADFVITMLWTGLQINFNVVPEKSFGAALYHFTGSMMHVQAAHKLAEALDLKINKLGIYKGDERLGGEEEADIFKQLNLSYIEPELRENNEELTAAAKRKLPKLITLKQLRGDLHSHTNNTDGRHSLQEMVLAAQKKGYEYLAITDHSQRLAMTHGLDAKRLLAQIKEIDQLNEQLQNFVILKSLEVDILEDGSLDMADQVLKELDITVCSVHSKFKLPEDIQTERIIRAMDNPYFNILGHATGRLINIREPYPINLEKIFSAAKERNCFIEINSQPARLDINDRYARLAKEMGLKFAISSDAHSIKQLDLVKWGIGQARRAWLQAEDIINTLSLEDLKRVLMKRIKKP